MSKRLSDKICVNELMESEEISILVDCLQKNDQPTLQYEATCAITSITSGTSNQTQIVVENGAIPLLLNLLQPSNLELCNQAACALGNIIGDSPHLRSKAIDLDIVPRLLNLIESNIPQPLLRTITWVVANICRDVKFPIPVAIITKVFPAICTLIYNNDTEILANVTYAISYLALIGKQQIKMIIDSNIVPFVVTRLLRHKEAKVQKAALRVIGNIVIEGEEFIQVLLDCDVLRKIPILLLHPNVTIVIEAIWFLCNMMMGNLQHIETIIDAGIVPLLFRQISQKDILKQSEGAWVIYILTTNSVENQISYLINQNIVPPLCNLLKSENIETILLCLKAMQSILENANIHLENVTSDIEAYGALDKIERLQRHECTDIYHLSYEIIAKYFMDD